MRDGCAARTVGRRLRRLRGARSLEEAAAAAEISAEALRSYEAGARMPRDEVKLRLARQYRCSIFDLFFSENSTKCDNTNDE